MSAFPFPRAIALIAALALAGGLGAAETAAPRPAMRDFIGVCGHTVQFKPELYKQVCRLVRDYHPVTWDIGEDSDFATTFPMARNKVSWEQVYGSWRKYGFDTDASLMFESLKQSKWKDIARDAHAYGLAFAKYFGPGGHGLVDAVEVGNEPGKWDDASYRTMFEGMAKGLRAGDPKLRIVTCAADAGKGGDYSKSLSCVKGLENLYDVINVHTYAQLDNWPTWHRGCPEDPKLIDYLPRVREIIAWRDANAAGKEVWITEFGYDSTTKPQQKTGDFKGWVGVTDTQQAQWLVRSYLVFSGMAVDRAYMYFFNDTDEPQFHGSSGLTRNFQPKPSFHATAHLYRSLGDYRFARAVAQQGPHWIYEYQHVTDAKQRIWVVWAPTPADQEVETSLSGLPGAVVKAERMPLAPGDAASAATFTAKPDGTVTATVGGSPLYLWIKLP
jgi:serine/threonine-protein kinase ATR